MSCGDLFRMDMLRKIRVKELMRDMTKVKLSIQKDKDIPDSEFSYVEYGFDMNERGFYKRDIKP